MDNNAQQNIDILIAELTNMGANINDPVSKLMAVTLLHQAQKIKDEIYAIPTRIVERLCHTFVPKEKIDAIPAIGLVQPSVKAKRDITPHLISTGCCFSYKIDPKQSLSYYPLYKTLLLPYGKSYLMIPSGLRTDESFTQIQFGKRGQVWLGLEISTEIENLENSSFLIKGTNGVLPKKISVCSSSTELMFTCADNMDNLVMMEPFDSQQMTPNNLTIISHWQNILSESESGRLIY